LIIDIYIFIHSMYIVFVIYNMMRENLENDIYSFNVHCFCNI